MRTFPKRARDAGGSLPRPLPRNISEADCVTGSEYNAQHHLNRPRTRLLGLLTLTNQSKGGAPNVQIGNALIQDVEEVRELRLVPEAEPLGQLERLASGH